MVDAITQRETQPETPPVQLAGVGAAETPHGILERGSPYASYDDDYQRTGSSDIVQPRSDVVQPRIGV